MYSINPHQLMNVNDINLSFKNRNPNGKLLSDFSGSNAFWDEYKDNSDLYDKEFVRMFKNFVYYNQDYFENGVDITADDEYLVATDFVEAVKMHLMKNDKKYSELYRINIVDDKDNSITQNYGITETIERTVNNEGSNEYGARTDVKNITEGTRSDTRNNTDGSRIDNREVTTGMQNNTIVEDIAGFNSSDYENANKTTQDSSARNDSDKFTKGEQVNSETFSKGQQVNDETFDKGSQSDTHKNTETENTTNTRTGNIGVKTVSQMLQEHSDFWNTWSFYNMIFQNICSDLLIIV